MVFLVSYNQIPSEGFIKNPIFATGNSQRAVENRRASSRRLIFPRSFIGMASTTKIRFGTCQVLNAARQNRRRSAFAYAAAIQPRMPPLLHCASADACGRPNTTACRTPLKRSKCASTSAGFTFFPATLITSEIRPTIRNPDSLFCSTDRRERKFHHQVFFVRFRKIAIAHGGAAHANLARRRVWIDQSQRSTPFIGCPTKPSSSFVASRS